MGSLFSCIQIYFFHVFQDLCCCLNYSADTMGGESFPGFTQRLYVPVRLSYKRSTCPIMTSVPLQKLEFFLTESTENFHK